MKKVSFFIIVLVLVFITGCLTACSPRIVERVERLTDTCYVSRQQRDSIYLRDSVYVREKGDTILMERWHTAWRERVRTDTVIVQRTDSIPMPYIVEKLVEKSKPTKWWQLVAVAIAAFLTSCCILKKLR
jgi:hypothetical protein